MKAYFVGLQEQGTTVSFYHRLRHVGYLRHLLVRKAAKTGEILIALVTTSQMPAGMERREAVTAVEGRLTVTDAKMARKQTAAAEEERLAVAKTDRAGLDPLELPVRCLSAQCTVKQFFHLRFLDMEEA